MKGTYNDSQVKYMVEFTDKKKDKIVVPFESVYGMESSDVVKQISQDGNATFKLKVCRKFKPDENDILCVMQTSEFLHIEARKGYTFEEVIGNYFQSNINSLKDIERIHGLCFLERYCMEYQEIKELISSNRRSNQNKKLVKTNRDMEAFYAEMGQRPIDD